MRKVVWADAAQADFLQAIAYIAQDNPLAAEKAADRIERAASRLGEMATGTKGRVSGTYEKVIVGLPYILAYAIRSQSTGKELVTILRVIHAARGWPSEQWPSGTN